MIDPGLRLRPGGGELEPAPRRPLVRRAAVLGMLIAVGAFAIDMYIPGFAAIARDLHASPANVQLSMTSFFMALAIGQVFFGPFSDAIGRKPPIFIGLGVFAAASMAAAFAPSIQALIAARFLQGIGAAASTVVPMAVIRDEHTGPDAARLMSLASLALSVSPILAPAFGGVLVQYTSWRLIFGVLIVISGLIALMTACFLPETLPPARRVGTGPVRILMTYAELIGNRKFLVPVMIAAFAQSVLFTFISGSPFVFVTLHHVPPVIYGVLFAMHAMALIGISQFNAPLMRIFGAYRLIGGACCVAAFASLVLVVLVASGMAALWPFIALTMIMFTAIGLIMTPAFLAALEPFGMIAGAASATAVALQLAVSTFMTFVLSLAADGTARPMAGVLAVSACAALAAWVALGRRP